MNEFFTSYIIMAITVIVSLKGFSDPAFTSRFLYRPYSVRHFNEHYRSISHIFLHNDPFHLIFNMIALYYFGPLVETFFRWDFGFAAGNILFIVFYLLGGIFATLLPFIRHKDHEYYAAVGASGAISAVIFAGIIFAPLSKMGLIFLPIRVDAYIFGPLYLVIEYIALRYGRTNIAHDAHISGALFGILFVLITNIDRVKLFIETIF